MTSPLSNSRSCKAHTCWVAGPDGHSSDSDHSASARRRSRRLSGGGRLPSGPPSRHLRRSPETTCRNGFTLIELLTVIALIAILAALVFTGMQQARKSADQASCLSNLKQMGVAISQYAAENNGKYPGPAWVSVSKTISERPDRWSYHPLTHYIAPYLGVTPVGSEDVTVRALVCPATERRDPTVAAHYQRISDHQRSPFGGVDGAMTNAPATAFNAEQRYKKPLSRIVAVYDMDLPGQGPIHSGGRHYLFLDGHVAWNEGTSLPK